jgi:hypothetical protein
MELLNETTGLKRKERVRMNWKSLLKLGAILSALAIGHSVQADTFDCKFDEFQGHRPLLPNQVTVQTRPNSGQVTITDTLSSSIGQSRLVGNEDRKRPKARRFTWELRRIPSAWIPATQKTLARNVIVLSLTVADGSETARLVSRLIIGSASASEGVINRAAGRCTRR